MWRRILGRVKGRARLAIAGLTKKSRYRDAADVALSIAPTALDIVSGALSGVPYVAVIGNVIKEIIRIKDVSGQRFSLPLVIRLLTVLCRYRKEMEGNQEDCAELLQHINSDLLPVKSNLEKLSFARCQDLKEDLEQYLEYVDNSFEVRRSMPLIHVTIRVLLKAKKDLKEWNNRPFQTRLVKREELGDIIKQSKAGFEAFSKRFVVGLPVSSSRPPHIRFL